MPKPRNIAQWLPKRCPCCNAYHYSRQVCCSLACRNRRTAEVKRQSLPEKHCKHCGERIPPPSPNVNAAHRAAWRDRLLCNDCNGERMRAHEGAIKIEVFAQINGLTIEAAARLLGGEYGRRATSTSTGVVSASERMENHSAAD